ncbi:hypothetical protein [Campylobacter geochelonis]|uniref:hypothetical protein n=1 Tax=Campylobacter geochelonis TaxID=1780362 RepID=UPI0007708CEC|nr:hypothetical protein [Campylobacter geochelonis]CZE49838.1 NADPH-dependent 7-cyano-7-deazaguanine reductase [Campylobacter geochelonis]
MKKVIFSVAVALFVAGCSYQNAPKEPTQQAVVKEDVINFVGPYDLILELRSSDNWESATLADNSDAVYKLKRAPSGSGIYLENEDGVSIHFKENYGIVELVKGKPINVDIIK